MNLQILQIKCSTCGFAVQVSTDTAGQAQLSATGTATGAATTTGAAVNLSANIPAWVTVGGLSPQASSYNLSLANWPGTDSTQAVQNPLGIFETADVLDLILPTRTAADQASFRQMIYGVFTQPPFGQLTPDQILQAQTSFVTAICQWDAACRAAQVAALQAQQQAILNSGVLQ